LRRGGHLEKRKRSFPLKREEVLSYASRVEKKREAFACVAKKGEEKGGKGWRVYFSRRKFKGSALTDFSETRAKQPKKKGNKYVLSEKRGGAFYSIPLKKREGKGAILILRQGEIPKRKNCDPEGEGGGGHLPYTRKPMRREKKRGNSGRREAVLFRRKEGRKRGGKKKKRPQFLWAGEKKGDFRGIRSSTRRKRDDPHG